MKNVFVFYRTWSYGGTEGRNLEKRNFDTIENAEKDALEDVWNYSFSLEEVTLSVNDKGRISETSINLKERIPCGRDLIQNANREKTRTK